MLRGNVSSNNPGKERISNLKPKSREETKGKGRTSQKESKKTSSEKVCMF